jgi:uncharacterized protein (TIGR00369 family)
MPPVMDKTALAEFMAREFSQVADEFTIEEVREMGVLIRLNVDERHLRPGGTVSGPSMFALADVSIYLAVLAMVGPKGLAVTTNISMDFMRKPAAATDLLCDCRLLKLGKTLAVGDCLIRSEGMEAPVARASMTYAIPPDR